MAIALLTRRRGALALAIFCLLFAGCDTKNKIDEARRLADRVATINDCFPGLWEAADQIVQHAQTWGRNDQVPLPAGFAYTLMGDGSVQAGFPLVGGTVQITIRFYSPTGVVQDLGLVDNGTFEDLIDQAATALAGLFGGQQPFMVGAWQLVGAPTMTGSGALTGIIGGTTNQNELQELRTTTSAVAGGPPPIADNQFEEHMGGHCRLTFRTDSLLTDAVPGQRYPIGTVTLVLTGEKATVEASIVFDGTVLAVLTVQGIPETFTVNLDTYSVTRNT